MSTTAQHPPDRPGLSLHLLPADALADRAVALVRGVLEGGASPADVAVLARVNSALLPIQVALSDAGLAHTAPLDASVLQRTGIRTALAYLRLGMDTDRLGRTDVLDTLNRPARKVKSAVLPHLPRGSRWPLAALQQVAEQLSDTHQERFVGYLGDLLDLSAALKDGADTAQSLWLIRNRIGLGEAMDALDASRSRPEGSSHGDDLDALEQLAALHPTPSTFAAWLTDRLRVPGEPTGVTLSTVHRVKGMEWPTVLVFAATQGLFPHRLADDVEEERRVFHVALTRCREQVHILADRSRPSPFLPELTTPSPSRPAATTPRAATQPDPTAPRFDAAGDLQAEVGVEVEVPGGLTGRICRLGRRHVVVAVTAGGRTVAVRLPHGTALVVGGRRCRVVAPTRPTTVAPGGPDAVDDRLFEVLRAWRSRVAADNGVPAYLVFHDRHLQVLAGRRPRTLRELAACPGVGPAKLERYGDDLLDLIANGEG